MRVCAVFCRIHYKEYLVGLVNRHGIDPAEVMTTEELTVLLERAEKKVPRRARDETVTQRTRQLLDVCSTVFKLLSEHKGNIFHI